MFKVINSAACQPFHISVFEGKGHTEGSCEAIANIIANFPFARHASKRSIAGFHNCHFLIKGILHFFWK